MLEGIVKHPYAIAVFESNLYWSDWATHSIQSCDKFFGKRHHTIIKDSKEYIYGISIFHSVLHTRTSNPCDKAFCSDICLLRGSGYSCACPQNKILGFDKHICKGKGCSSYSKLWTLHHLFLSLVILKRNYVFLKTYSHSS